MFKFNTLIISCMLASTALTAQEYITPADMPEAAQDQMYVILTDYNKCMMNGRLSSSHDGQKVQQAAENIMQSCEPKLDELEALLLTNKVEESLTIGMTKKMRSRAARQLMTKSMNNMAAQASAMANADQPRPQNTAQ